MGQLHVVLFSDWYFEMFLADPLLHGKGPLGSFEDLQCVLCQLAWLALERFKSVFADGFMYHRAGGTINVFYPYALRLMNSLKDCRLVGQQRLRPPLVSVVIMLEHLFKLDLLPFNLLQHHVEGLREILIRILHNFSFVDLEELLLFLR